MILTRYELARILGLRSLQLSEGDPPKVFVSNDDLRRDFLYVAALELQTGVLDVCVKRADGNVHHISTLSPPNELGVLLETRAPTH